MKAYNGSLGVILSLVLGLASCSERAPHAISAMPLPNSPSGLATFTAATSGTLSHPTSETRLARAATASSDTSGAEAVREALLAEGVLTLLQRRHLRTRPLDDATSKAAFDIFLSWLDPRKLYLTQTDVHHLRQYASALDDQLSGGRLDLGHEAGVLKRRRAALVAPWVQALLSQPFDFTRGESLELTGKKRAFCQNDEALRERWRRVLKYEVLVLIERAKKTEQIRRQAATDDADNAPPKTDVELEAESRTKLAERYEVRFDRIAKEKREDDIERLINAFVRVYDPHTTYLPPYRKENLDIRMSGALEGIGAVLRQEEGLIKVQRIVPGSASWRQGQLQAEDIILAVAQAGGEPVDVVDTRLREAVQLIRGKKGTVVKLTVRKPDGNVVVIPITREVVRLDSTYVKAAVLELQDMTGRFAYIHLPTFYGSVRGRRPARRASVDIWRALAKLEHEDVRGLILDVRGNGGGFLHEAVRVSGLFITNGPILQTRNANGKQEVLKDKDKSIAFTGPLVVLVDGFSASASEIVAAALQDYGRAVVLGSATHGKGTVQHLHSLDKVVGAAPTMPSLGTLKLTQYQFYRINGASTQLRGVIPDVPLPNPMAHLDIGERSKDNAISWNAIEPAPYDPWPHRWDTESLRTKSLARQADNDMFTKVTERTTFLRQQRDDTIESLDKTVWFQRRAHSNAALDALELDDAARFKVHPVAYTKNTHLPQEEQDKIAMEWAQELHDDPWIEEALRVVDDMTGK